MGLTPALLYFTWIVWKGTLGLWDAAILVSIYATYLVILQRSPPKVHEEIADAGAVPRAVMSLPSRGRALAVIGLFVVGGVMLYLTSYPFLMNMASSNINQWTVLAAMIPVVYSMSLGHPAAIPLAEHRTEVVLTLLQGALGVVLLANFNFQAYEALGLLLFWCVQFVVPDSRTIMCYAYGGWLALELVSALWRPGRLRAFLVFPRLWRTRGQAG